MMTTGVVISTLLFLSMVTFLSVFEMSLSRMSKVTSRRLFEKNKSKLFEQLKVLVDNRLEVLISVYVGIQVCMVAFAILVTGYLHNELQSYSKALPAAFGIMFLVVVVFRQLIPRLFTFKKPERVLLPLVPVYNFIRPALNVISYPLSSTLRLFAQLNSQDEVEKTEKHIEEEIQAFINVGKDEGILEKDEGKLIQSVVEFGDKVAGDIMTPRTEMVTIGIGSSPEEIKKLMVQTKYSRIPVYRDHVENIVGVFYLKDLLDIWDSASANLNLEKMVRPIQFFSETKRVSELLTELQQQASHIAVVVDEFGGVAGLVTIEDILEEIAGEIHDEDEIGEMMQLTQDKDGRYLVPGSLPIQQLEELFGIELKTEENSTIAGLMNSFFGRVPRKGERYEHQGLQFEVKDADRRKVYKLLVSKTVPKQEERAEMRTQS